MNALISGSFSFLRKGLLFPIENPLFDEVASRRLERAGIQFVRIGIF